MGAPLAWHAFQVDGAHFAFEPRSQIALSVPSAVGRALAGDSPPEDAVAAETIEAPSEIVEAYDLPPLDPVEEAMPGFLQAELLWSGGCNLGCR